DQGFLTPKWGRITPFAMTSGDQFRSPSPPSLDSEAYAAAYNEVLVLGAIDAETADRNGDGAPDRTPEQTQIGLFWAYDGSPGLGVPPRLYNQIARTVAMQQGNSLADNARMFALANIAMADAGIASWESKYTHDLWRPVLAIRLEDTVAAPGGLDGNPDTAGEADWAPLGAPASNSGDPSADFTPPFPAYTSGHATFGAAMFRTLERFFGTDDIAFDFQSDELNGVTRGSDGVVRPAVTRRFDSFSEAALENAQSRIYLGIHWSFDATEGVSQGNAVADYVFDHKLRPLPLPPAIGGMLKNERQPLDVSGDGRVDIGDVVMQVGQIRHMQETGELDPEFRGFRDVNGDRTLSMADLLMVVSKLRQRQLEEGVLPVGPRSIDGSGNNADNPGWGVANVELLDMVGLDYADGMAEMAGHDRPSPRMVSNLVMDQRELRPNARGMSDMVWQWGQFLDHDISLTPEVDPAEPAPISVPAGDPFFDPFNTGAQTIRFQRSKYDPATGDSPETPRRQMNVITAYIDGSNVYGSDDERAAALRTFEGGRLTTSDGELLPFNEEGLPNANPLHLPASSLFLAGDERANEQTGLTAMHALWVREHNRRAGEIAAEHPNWTDEQIYQEARETVIALLQSITYNEFIPALLGEGALPAYQGYDDTVNVGISSLFSTAAYRVGHTMLSSQLLRVDDRGEPIEAGPLSLRDAFFSTRQLLDHGIDSVLKGLASQRAQEIDTKIVDDVRNFLFGPPGAGGVDLASLNIQRGRDHGLPDYNSVRESLGLPRAETFADISSDPDLAAALEAAYGDVDAIDVWVGALAEDHLPGGSVGELIHMVLADQFRRLRDGDAYWYERLHTPEEIAEIESTSLADVIRRNTAVANLQDHVFFV
ncbi:MAG: phosphatase PAP2 family protein, partial [Planctomycetes bacterium]|nr:phosphatase PAP2 family protein [Planctomycetota bacterium]